MLGLRSCLNVAECDFTVFGKKAQNGAFLLIQPVYDTAFAVNADIDDVPLCHYPDGDLLIQTFYVANGALCQSD